MLPGRMSILPMLEEEAGVKATWQEFDAALWVAAFCQKKDLDKVVANPMEFMENTEKVVLGFPDPIPACVNM